MAKRVFNDALVWYAETDISGLSNQCTFNASVDPKVCTTFASAGWAERVGGIKSAQWDIAGYLDDTDGTLRTNIQETDTEVPVSLVIAETAATVAEGDVSYSIGAIRTSVNTPGDVGEVEQYSVTAMSTRSGGVGQVIDYQTGITSTSNSTGIQFGALAATEVFQANLHVFSGTGTIVFTLESDDNSGFTTATTRATWAVSAIGSEMETVAGAVTDDYWRLVYTVTSGTWEFGCCGGIY